MSTKFVWGLPRALQRRFWPRKTSPKESVLVDPLPPKHRNRHTSLKVSKFKFVCLYVCALATRCQHAAFCSTRPTTHFKTQHINCMQDPEEYENQYTLLNSFWFTMGALMQQGSDVAPIALCVRSVGSVKEATLREPQ